MPNISLNPLAIALSTVAIFFLSHLWYSLLFGRQWAREMGVTPGESPSGTALARSLGLTLLGAALMSFVLANQMAVWLPATWGVSSPAPDKLGQAGSAAVFTWLGFLVPALLHRVAWEKHSWTLWAIHAGYYLSSLAIAALILALMG